MVTVTEIRMEKSLICIQLDNNEQVWIKKEDMAGLGLYVGLTMDEKDFYRRVGLLQFPKALNLAVSSLAVRPCSKEEIRTKLRRRRYLPEVTELVVRKLENENLLNDMDFSEQWATYRIGKEYGPRRILSELRQKGVSEQTAVSAVDSINSEDTFRNAVSLAVKAWKRRNPAEPVIKSRQKIIAALVRKGYDWTTAKEASDMAEKEI